MEYILGAISLITFILILFLPYFIARSRDHRFKTKIFWMNLLFGWTLIFWIPLIIYALVSDAKESTPEIKNVE